VKFDAAILERLFADLHALLAGLQLGLLDGNRIHLEKQILTQMAKCPQLGRLRCWRCLDGLSNVPHQPQEANHVHRNPAAHLNRSAPPPAPGVAPNQPLNLWEQIPPLKQKRLVVHLSRMVQGRLGKESTGGENEPDR
jgi:hypothetical protein